jgi:hypothetical protein
MRWMSFALTSGQVRHRLKTVTRRMGWRNLTPGTVLKAALKCQGLKNGERPIEIGRIRVVAVSRERLDAITAEDVRREGFSEMSPANFVSFFCEANHCEPDAEVTRIEFEYV